MGSGPTSHDQCMDHDHCMVEWEICEVCVKGDNCTVTFTNFFYNRQSWVYDHKAMKGAAEALSRHCGKVVQPLCGYHTLVADADKSCEDIVTLHYMSGVKSLIISFNHAFELLSDEG